MTLTTKEASKILNVGSAEVRYLIRTKKLKALKRGRDYFIEADDLKSIKYIRPPKGRRNESV